jgi:hypothetical protein
MNMPHIILLRDEEGNIIGEYPGDHEGDQGGRTQEPTGTVNADFWAAVKREVGGKDVDEVTVKFKGK